MNNSAIAGTWAELEKELFTAEEIAESHNRIAKIIAESASKSVNKYRTPSPARNILLVQSDLVD